MPETVNIHGKNFRIFLKEKEILQQIEDVANKISVEYREKQPLFLIVLKGGFMFGSELVGRFRWPCHLGFVAIRSYEGMKSTGKVQVSGLDPEVVTGRDVIVIEDIVDSGRTLHKFLPMLNELKPKSVKIATLLSKPEAIKFSVPVTYACFDIPDDFVVGFGLDFDGLGRNLRNIYQITSNT